MSLALVQQIKHDLEARGVDLSGPCGAFEITKRVAWALRDTGAGLVYKRRPQNGCYADGSMEGYGVDVVMWRNATYRDILVDSGGANEPNWPGPEPIDPGLWREPIDPGDTPAPPTPPPLPPPNDLQRQFNLLASRTDALAARIEFLELQVRTLERRPWPYPAYRGRLFGFTIRSTPEV